MKILSKIVLALLLSITTVWAAKKALIAGIPSHFQGGARQGIEIDISIMENMLSEYGFEIEKLTNEAMTTGSLRNKLKEYQSLGPDDVFVFYYSGHGAQIPDSNGDEADGKDETIVLYDHPMDGSSTGLLVDDEMYSLLVNIPAKKFVFFDSCHSGSAYKSSSGPVVSKSLGYLSKAMGITSTQEPGVADKRSILFFGAAKDHQQSLATPSGSMFTLSLLDGIKRKKADTNADGRTTFRELLDFSTRDIERQTQNCPAGQCPLFSPDMHGREDVLDQDIFVAMDIDNKSSGGGSGGGNSSEIEAGLDDIMNSGQAKVMTLKTQDSYQDGEKIELEFDSGSYEGYLSILYIDNTDITILYPNKFQPQEKRYQGRVSFPSSITTKFELKAMKPYGRTVGYVIISEEPLGLYGKGKGSVFKTLSRGSYAAKALLKGMEVKEKGTMMIGKAVFDVKGGY